MRNLFFVMLTILVGCSPSSIEEYQSEGESLAKNLISELSKVQSLKDLKNEGGKLKKEYNRLVDLMIAAKKFQNRHPYLEVPLSVGLEVSEDLKKEFIRIYQLEGCLEVMEALQRESLHRLDLYHKRSEALKIQTFR